MSEAVTETASIATPLVHEDERKREVSPATCARRAARPLDRQVLPPLRLTSTPPGPARWCNQHCCPGLAPMLIKGGGRMSRTLPRLVTKLSVSPSDAGSEGWEPKVPVEVRGIQRMSAGL